MIWRLNAISPQEALTPNGNRKSCDISVWEIAVPHAKGRLQLSVPLRDWVRDALSPVGIAHLPLDAEFAAESALLAGQPHPDPADRFFIATARTKSLILATRDRTIIEYGNAGHVHVLEL
jgi:PIN domain nuclease of toxin-antitoxin system